MLLDNPSAQHVGHQSHGDAVFMVGQTDHHIRKLLLVAGNHAQVQILVLGRIGGCALQDAQMGVDRHDGIVGSLDIVQASASGAQKNRLAETGDMLLKRGIF